MTDWVYRLPYELIQELCTAHAIEPQLVAAIVMVESGGKTYATRYEEHYPWVHKISLHAFKLGISRETERIEQQISWGLMQIMGATAREMGFRGFMPELCKPAIGLKYGILFLKEKLRIYPDGIEKAIAAYNAGSARIDENGRYLPNSTDMYVHKVMRRYDELWSISEK